MRTLAPDKIEALERMATGSGGEAANARAVLEKVGRRVPAASSSAIGPPMKPPGGRAGLASAGDNLPVPYSGSRRVMGAIGTGSASRRIVEKGGGMGRSGSSVPPMKMKKTAENIVSDVPKTKGFLKSLTKGQKYGIGAAAAVVAGLAYQKQRQDVNQRFR